MINRLILVSLLCVQSVMGFASDESKTTNQCSQAVCVDSQREQNGQSGHDFALLIGTLTIIGIAACVVHQVVKDGYFACFTHELLGNVYLAPGCIVSSDAIILKSKADYIAQEADRIRAIVQDELNNRSILHVVGARAKDLFKTILLYGQKAAASIPAPEFTTGL